MRGLNRACRKALRMEVRKGLVRSGGCNGSQSIIRFQVSPLFLGHLDDYHSLYRGAIPLGLSPYYIIRRKQGSQTKQWHG
jgi:hypothetical protein